MASDSIWKSVYTFDDQIRKSKKVEYRPSATTGSVDMGDGMLCMFGGESGSQVHVAEIGAVMKFHLTDRNIKESVIPPEHGIDNPTGICIGKL